MQSFTDLNHPLRAALSSELHSRPFMRIDPPQRILHLAIFSDSDMSLHSVWLADLCKHFQVTGLSPVMKHCNAELGAMRLKWECHTEFSTYTFVIPEVEFRHFPHEPLKVLPAQWLKQLSGHVMTAVQVIFEAAEGRYATAMDDSVRNFVSGAVIAGAKVLAGAEVWTDFQIYPDGVNRFLIRDVGLREQQAGRLVQRVLEIETYRMMAMLALPLAQDSQPKIRKIEIALSALSESLVDASTSDKEQELLSSLTKLSSRIEAITEANNYRFGATEAYWRIVKSRIAELREERIEGVPTIDEFMERRLVPAIEFCRSVRERQENLSERLARANALLRTRVSLSQEQQNSAILASLNQRAELQLRLQQAVEGLSTVAITYYLLGLLGYLFKSFKSLGIPINPDIMSSISLPIVLGSVWWGVRRLRHTLSGPRQTE